MARNTLAVCPPVCLSVCLRVDLYCLFGIVEIVLIDLTFTIGHADIQIQKFEPLSIEVYQDSQMKL